MAKKIEMEGMASLLEDIADAMRSLDKLTQDELDHAVSIYNNIDIIIGNMNSDNIEYARNAINNLETELPKGFEYEYDLLLEAHVHLRAADSLIERFLDF